MESPTDSVAAEEDASVAYRRAIYEAFAQHEYYVRAWQPLLGTARGSNQFNWAAALFGMTWCFYRKMYGVGLLLLVGVVAVALFASVVVLFVIPGIDVEGQEFGWVLTGVALLAIRVPFGFLANKVYLRKANRVLEDERTKGLSPDELLVRLRDRGGTSGIGVAAAIAISVAARFVGM